MSKNKTRSGSVLFSLKDTVFKECEVLDLAKPVQLPTVKYVIKRFYTIKRQLGVQKGCHEFALREVTLE